MRWRKQHKGVCVSWNIKWVRSAHEPETRWFHRYILRRRLRYAEKVLFVGPAPPGARLDHNINGYSRLTVPVPVDDALAALAAQYPADLPI